MRPALDVADIFRAHGPAWRQDQAGHLSLSELKVMSAIEACRTAGLGGHVERCEDCAHVQIAYNSSHGHFRVKEFISPSVVPANYPVSRFEPGFLTQSFPNQINLTFGRCTKRRHHHPAFGG